MKQILFVDDEPKILQELKVKLLPHQREWKMRFAVSGPDALKILAQHEMDVVVSDLQMPGMDGAELFENIKNSYPNAVRIILSDQFNKKTDLKSLKSFHRFLTKSCNAKDLKYTIQSALDLRDLLQNETVSNLVSQIETLPSLPTLYMEIVDALNKEDSSLVEIATIVKKDVSMTVEILKLVNSSFFGIFNTISNIEQAVSLLGMNMIKTLVLSIKVFSQFPKQDQISISINELWEHSFLVGILTAKIVFDYTKDKELEENAFTVGLLHDLGIIILASQLPQKYKKAYEHAFINQLTISECEYKFLGSSHTEVAAYMIGLWGFSDQIKAPIAHHHLQNTNEDEVDFLTLALHVADNFAQKLNNKNLSLPLEEINKVALLDRRFRENNERWFKLCTEIYNKEEDKKNSFN